MPRYTIEEIMEMKSLIETLLQDGHSYNGQERATEVGALLQAHVFNQTPIAELREAVATKERRDKEAEDFLQRRRDGSDKVPDEEAERELQDALKAVERATASWKA